MREDQGPLRAVILRQFYAALKTFGLYAAHASAQTLHPGLGATLQEYLRSAGPLTIHVGWDRLTIGDDPLQEGGASALARYLSARNVTSMTIRPGISDQELELLLRGLAHDREMLEALGGIEQVLPREALVHVSVISTTPGDPIRTELETQTSLLHGDRLSTEQRDLVLEILRRGPTEAARLLATLYERVKDSGEDQALPLLVQALDALDRTILDQPSEDQESLLGALARAHALLPEPLRSNLTRELIRRAAGGGAARTILAELSGEDLPQVTDVLRQLDVVPGDLARIIASLQPVSGARGFTTEPAPSASAPGGESIGEEWAEIPAELVALLPGEERALAAELAQLTEPNIIVDTVMTLTNVLHLEDDPEQLAETATVIAGHLPALAAAGRADLVASTLDVLREVAGRAGEHRASIEAIIGRARKEAGLDLP